MKIVQHLAKIWTKYDSLVFWGHPVCQKVITGNSVMIRYQLNSLFHWHNIFHETVHHP